MTSTLEKKFERVRKKIPHHGTILDFVWENGPVHIQATIETCGKDCDRKGDPFFLLISVRHLITLPEDIDQEKALFVTHLQTGRLYEISEDNLPSQILLAGNIIWPL